MSANARVNEVGSSHVSELNVYAEPYIPLSLQQESRIRRSLFMTFSSGLPLNPKDIHEHFMRAYGDCVEFVYVHREEGRLPEFGRILFQSEDVAARILGDRNVVKMFIRGKPIWLKKYIPRPRNYRFLIDE